MHAIRRALQRSGCNGVTASAPQHISREAIDEHRHRTATPIAGWVLAHYRGWAWMACPTCPWWMVSGSQDLLPAWADHLTDEAHLACHH